MYIMVDNLNIQKVLAPVALTARVKKAGREKNKSRPRSFEEELKKKKEKKKELLVDKQKSDKRTNIEKKGSLKEKHPENTENIETKSGKVIDIHV